MTNIKFIVAPNDEVIVGAPNDIDWDDAFAIRTGDNIQIVSRQSQFELNHISHYPELIKRIDSKRSFVLSYINNDSPVFSRLTIDESSY